MYSDSEENQTCFSKESAPGPDSGFLSGAISTEQSTSEYEIRAEGKASSEDKSYSRLDSGLDLSTTSNGDSLLHALINQPHPNLQQIKQLISTTPSLVNELNDYSQTPLHYACMAGECSVTRLLIQSGALQIQDDGGNIPLHYAVRSGDPESVELLLEQGDAVDIYNYEGLTPLHTSVTSSTCNLLHLLLPHSNPNIRELKSGQSTLHLAIEYRSGVECIKQLIRSGSSLTLENYSRLNPYEYAVERREYGIAREILKLGGGGWVRDEDYDSSSDEDEPETRMQPIPVSACS